MTNKPRRGERGEGRVFSIRAEAGRAEILLYDAIDPWYGISAKDFHAQLKALGEVSAIDLRINSPGGSITEGMAIHSILKRQEARVVAHVDGIAASMASVVAMAADEIVMADGSYMMIHNPLGMAVGDSEEMRELADLLDKMKGQLVNIYAARTSLPADEIAALMDADTWFTAGEAVAKGFADRTSAELALAASFDPNRFNHVPEKLKGDARMSQNQNQNQNQNQEPQQPANQTPAAPPPLPAAPRAASYRELKAALPGADAEFITSQLEADATAAQAQTAWMAEQNKRIEAANKAAEDAKAKAQTNAMGVEPLGGATGAAFEGDPIVAWNEALAAKLKTDPNRARAVRAVARDNPDLHEAYIAAVNAQRKRPSR